MTHPPYCVAVLHVLCLTVWPASGVAGAELPEGNQGIAARYPGDMGIERDTRVLFVEKFDAASVEEVAQRWDTASDTQIMSLSSDRAPGTADRTSLLMSYVGGEGTGGQLYRQLTPGHNQVFARFYVKFAADCEPIHHFGTHLGGFNPPTAWPQGGAGLRPEGTKRFTTGVEPYGDHWQWDFYTYWQEMRANGDGNYWGTPFLAGVRRPPVAKDRWICVEMMVKMNSLAKDAPDGEQAFWIDGKLWRVEDQIVIYLGPGFPRGRWTGGWWQPDHQSDTTFDGFRWRSTEKLAVNYIWTYLYITKARAGSVSNVWFDNIVVATEYIGPVATAPK
ncbi:MAG: hypothetical protein ACYC6N_24640 [Pirellulaceae bacterium]